MPEINRELAELQSKFKEFYDTHLGAKFTELETIRLKNVRFFWKWLGAFFITSLVIVWMGSDEIIRPTIYHSEAFSYVIGFYILIIIITLHIPFINYKVDTKYMVMEQIIKFFGDYKYERNMSISTKIIEKSALFGPLSRKESDDYFEGTYNGVKMQVSEERIVRAVSTPKGKRESIVFKGVLILLDMNKSFSGQTVVYDDWGFFNFMMSSPKCLVNQQNVKLDHVRLEDSIFEKQFEAFSSDQIEARYLLTTAFMERILEIKRLFHGKKIQFSFFDNELLIAISTRKDMFETTSLFTTTARYGKMREVVSQFYSIFSIIDILKLDKRIGM